MGNAVTYLTGKGAFVTIQAQNGVTGHVVEIQWRETAYPDSVV